MPRATVVTSPMSRFTPGMAVNMPSASRPRPRTITGRLGIRVRSMPRQASPRLPAMVRSRPMRPASAPATGEKIPVAQTR